MLINQFKYYLYSCLFFKIPCFLRKHVNNESMFHSQMVVFLQIFYFKECFSFIVNVFFSPKFNNKLCSWFSIWINLIQVSLFTRLQSNIFLFILRILNLFITIKANFSEQLVVYIYNRLNDK